LLLVPLLYQRPGNLRMMEWAELDLDAGLWTIPSERMKSTRPEKEDGGPLLGIQREDTSVPAGQEEMSVAFSRQLLVDFCGDLLLVLRIGSQNEKTAAVGLSEVDEF